MSAGNERHPMRLMTRRAAGLEGDGWDDEARRDVAGFFDTLAPEWHTRNSPERTAVVVDALTRGLEPLGGSRGLAVEVGSGIGAYSALVAERYAAAVAVEVAIEMSRLAPAGPAHRVLADGAVLPVADGTVDAVVLVNAFLFPAEVERALAADGVVVWVNSSGPETPIYLSTDDVVRALPFAVKGSESRAGVGTWCVLQRSHE